LETLYEDTFQFAKEMKATEGNEIGLWIEENVPHDPFLLGNVTGFEGAAKRVGLKAVDFLRDHRLR
jgi:hypothetical protein